MGFILGIDVGTTAVKAIVFDHNGNITGIGVHELPLIFPRPDWIEQDPNIIWKTVLNSVEEAVVKSGIKKKEIQAIGIAHQGESAIAWDSKTGEPYYNNILQQDRRTTNRCDELKKQEALDKQIREKTGLLIDSFFTGTKFEWMISNVPQIKNNVQKGRVKIGTLDSWMIWHLSGGKSFYTDYTSAGRTMLFNLQEKCWDKDLLGVFSIPEEILATPTFSSNYFGMSDPKVFAGIEAPITGAAVDTQCAFFGQLCFNKGDIKSTYGTSNVIQLNIGNKPVIPKGGITITIGIGLEDNIKYAAEGIILITGAAVQWLRDGLGIITQAAQTEEIVETVKDTMGVYFIPAFVGLTTPYWNQHTRGTITGLTRGVKKEHLVRATLESIAYQVKDVIDAMEKETGVTIQELRVDGGPAKNSFLMQFQSDILGVPIIVPKTTEITCQGAAFMAGLCTGFWKDSGEIESMWRVEKTYTPSMDTKKADELYNGWKKAINGAINIYNI